MERQSLHCFHCELGAPSGNQVRVAFYFGCESWLFLALSLRGGGDKFSALSGVLLAEEQKNIRERIYQSLDFCLHNIFLCILCRSEP